MTQRWIVKCSECHKGKKIRSALSFNYNYRKIASLLLKHNLEELIVAYLDNKLCGFYRTVFT
jgi:hypothetical protein